MTLDPRHDLPEDTDIWNSLLALAWDSRGDPRGVWSLLDGIRCLGARLTWNSGWRIDKGDIPVAEWGIIRVNWLMPRREQITALLAKLPPQ
jgi:hypothetical protein